MRSPVGPFRARHWRCLSEDIDQESFAHKHTELRDRLASIKLQLDPVDRSHDETAELAARVFELLQIEIQCRFVFSRNPVSVRIRNPEIRCQFVFSRNPEIRCQFVFSRNPVSVGSPVSVRLFAKSGVGSSFRA